MFPHLASSGSEQSSVLAAVLPRPSARALRPAPFLTASALEARSVLSIALHALHMTAAEADRTFVSIDVQLQGGSGSRSKAFFHWVEGRGAIRSARAYVDGRLRRVVEVLCERCPSIAPRIGHPIFKALDVGSPLSRKVGLGLLSRLDPFARSCVLVDDVRGRPLSLFFLGRLCRTRKDVANDETRLADLAAALLIWLRLQSPDAVRARARPDTLLHRIREVVEQFCLSSWIPTEDRQRVADAIANILEPWWDPLLSVNHDWCVRHPHELSERVAQGMRPLIIFEGDELDSCPTILAQMPSGAVYCLG